MARPAGEASLPMTMTARASSPLACASSGDEEELLQAGSTVKASTATAIPARRRPARLCITHVLLLAALSDSRATRREKSVGLPAATMTPDPTGRLPAGL